MPPKTPLSIEDRIKKALAYRFRRTRDTNVDASVRTNTETALYRYLHTNLKSKRLRGMLEEGAKEHQNVVEWL